MVRYEVDLHSQKSVECEKNTLIFIEQSELEDIICKLSARLYCCQIPLRPANNPPNRCARCQF